MHTGNCFLNGLEVTKFQVMADRLYGQAGLSCDSSKQWRIV